MNLTHSLHFLRNYVREPRLVGAVAPSSRPVAAALAEPFRSRTGPLRILEVGAGTGSVTRYLGEIFGPDDQLDICEVNPEFGEIIRRDVLSFEPLASGVRRGAVRLWIGRVQDIDPSPRFDCIVSGLPLTVFPLAEVRAIFDLLRGTLTPGGVLSYFEYEWMRWLCRTWSIGRRRSRFLEVSAFLDEQIRRHQIRSTLVLWNLPPARIRHLRFTCAEDKGRSACQTPSMTG